MANANVARGLVPVRLASGAPYNGSGNIYCVPASYATALYVGDPLIPTGSSDANGIPIVNRATAAGGNYTIGPMVGLVDGGEPITGVTRDLPLYRAASTLAYILVADDPNLLFEIQEDGVGGAMGADASMGNVDLIAGNGVNGTGFSGWMADSSTLNTTNTLQLRVLRPAPRADNDGTLTLAKWWVKINLHSITNTTGL